MNKRGQIFLIAALVIVIIISGFGIYNVVKTPKEDTKVYDLSKEISYENSKIIDTGVYSNSTQDAIANKINDTIDYYAQANPDSEIAVIYGNASQITEGNATNLFYTFKDSGTIGIDNSQVEVRQREITNTSVNVIGQKVVVKISGQDYEFNITEGQNFYLVVKVNKEGGQFVESK